MKTTIEIYDQLMEAAIKACGAKTVKDTVEFGLKTLIRLKNQANVKNLRGKLNWIGNLDEMRS